MNATTNTVAPAAADIWANAPAEAIAYLPETEESYGVYFKKGQFQRSGLDTEWQDLGVFETLDLIVNREKLIARPEAA